MKKISVIIPVYNQLEFFKKCINSVCNQAYRNLEIICVDDGSTDGVDRYLDKIAKSDDRLIVIHQKNAGESNARNRALELASGDYITFVDCDDWIDAEMYATLVKIAEKDDLDMVASSWYKEINGKSEEIHNELEVEKGIINRDELLKYIYMRDSYRGFAYMWNKLYKKKILMNGTNIRFFDESLKLGGDVVYLAGAAIKVKKAKYIDKAFYHYRIRKGSGSHSEDCEKIRDWVKSYELTVGILRKEKISNQTVKYAIRFMAYHAMEGLQVAIKLGDNKNKQYFKRVMKENSDVYIELNKKNPERINEFNRLMRL